MAMKGKLALKCAYILTILSALTLASLGSRAVTAISENMPPEWERCYIIDPGHGGVDGGATSCTGKPESAFNLEISLRLRDLLHFMGCQTRMIRTDDSSVYTAGETISAKKMSDLKERVRICNETEGAVLLSIHQNMFPESRYSGAQVFYPATENSDALANALQKSMITWLNPGSNRNAKRSSNVYLLEHISCPGVLIECGFLSNPEEEARLRSEEYQKQLCCVIAATVTQFYDER